MNKKLTTAIALCASVYSGALLANNNNVSSQLESVINTHVTATSKDSESIEDVMKTMHSESPASMHIKVGLEQMFPVFDLDMSLTEFGFVGVSGDYAMARVKQKMEKVSGPATFKNQVIEQVFVFKQEQNQWKIWQAMTLDVDYF